MVYLNTTKATYERLKSCLPDLIPDIKIDVLVMDENLERLGFCESAPCTLTINLNSKELEDLLEELDDIEMRYYSYESYFNCKNYEKYCWMYPIFFSAKVVDKK